MNMTWVHADLCVYFKLKLPDPKSDVLTIATYTTLSAMISCLPPSVYSLKGLSIKIQGTN